MGKSAFGAKWERETVTPGTYAAVADVLDVNPPQYSAETHETTTHDTPDGFKTFMGGLKDAGEISVELLYDPTKHNVLIDDLGNSHNYRVTLPLAADNTCDFAAVLTKFDPQTPREGKMAATATYKVSGKPAWSTV